MVFVRQWQQGTHTSHVIAQFHFAAQREWGKLTRATRRTWPVSATMTRHGDPAMCQPQVPVCLGLSSGFNRLIANGSTLAQTWGTKHAEQTGHSIDALQTNEQRGVLAGRTLHDAQPGHHKAFLR